MNPLTISAAHLARLRKICLALPEATEKVAWGDPTWRVRDKIFAMQKGNYDGGRPSLWLKAADGVQNVLVDSKPKRFFVPPYVGLGWRLHGRGPHPVVAGGRAHRGKLPADRTQAPGFCRTRRIRNAAQRETPRRETPRREAARRETEEALT